MVMIGTYDLKLIPNINWGAVIWIILGLIAFAALIIFLLEMKKYKINVLIMQKRSGSTKMIRDKAKKVAGKDGTVKYYLRKTKKNLSPAAFEHIISSAKGDYIFLYQRGEGDYVFVKPPEFNTETMTDEQKLTLVEQDMNFWWVQQQKEAEAIYRYGFMEKWGTLIAWGAVCFCTVINLLAIMFMNK